MTVSHIHAGSTNRDGERETFLVRQTKPVVGHHRNGHQARLSSHGQVAESVHGFWWRCVSLNWTALRELFTFRGLRTGFSPDHANGSVVPVGLDNLVVPRLVVIGAHRRPVEQVTTVHTGDVEPRFLMNDVDEEHVPGCVGRVAAGLNASDDAKRALHVAGQRPVDVQIVDQCRAVLQLLVEIVNRAVHLGRGVFVLLRVAEGPTAVELVKVDNTNTVHPPFVG